MHFLSVLSTNFLIFSCHFPSSQIRYVNLSDIQLDIMDYIRPAECKAEDFRGMWAEFEWENKVSYDPLISITREAVITSPSSLEHCRESSRR